MEFFIKNHINKTSMCDQIFVQFLKNFVLMNLLVYFLLPFQNNPCNILIYNIIKICRFIFFIILFDSNRFAQFFLIDNFCFFVNWGVTKMMQCFHYDFRSHITQQIRRYIFKFSFNANLNCWSTSYKSK